MMLFPSDVEKQIQRLVDKGVDPIKEDYIIVASKGVQFFEGLYPLEIVISKHSPANTVYLLKRSIKEIKIRKEF